MPRRQDLPISLPLCESYAAKPGQTWLPRGRSLVELSVGVTPLRFLNWPLIRGPLVAVRQHPYAGVPFKRSVPFAPP